MFGETNQVIKGDSPKTKTQMKVVLTDNQKQILVELIDYALMENGLNVVADVLEIPAADVQLQINEIAVKFGLRK